MGGMLPTNSLLVAPREGLIGWSAGDFAPTPSHTTGRAVFRIRRLNAAVLLHGDRKIGWNKKPVLSQDRVLEGILQRRRSGQMPGPF